MHSQPFLGEVVGHHRCQPFENLQLDIQTAEFVSGARGITGLSELGLQACWNLLGQVRKYGWKWGKLVSVGCISFHQPRGTKLCVALQLAETFRSAGPWLIAHRKNWCQQSDAI